ncbi:MAG: RDD family protein [Opitutaceae bacterium]
MNTFSARETQLLRELDGLELAGFWQRAAAFLVDCFLMAVLLSVLTTLVLWGWQRLNRVQGHKDPVDFHLPVVKELSVPVTQGGMKVELINIEGNEAVHIAATVVVPVLYCGVLLWAGKGRTPGKRLMKIRVVSLTHRHITFWHAVERALGYGAAALELGFGFAQFFIHPYRRCAQDRLAETIVVTERSYQALQPKLSQKLIADGPLESPPNVS